MITDQYELQEELEKLRRQTFPLVWQEFDTRLTGDLVEDLKTLITQIAKSEDWELKRKASLVIEESIDIKVDYDPSFTIRL